MFHKRDNNKSLEELLWQKINNSIINSEEVKLLILELEKVGKLDSASENDLVISVRQLIQSILKQKQQINEEQQYLESLKEKLLLSGEEENPDSPLMEIENSNEVENIFSNLGSCPNKPLQWIDGRPLSENEILFQEYVDRNFDEDGWLKKFRIRR